MSDTGSEQNAEKTALECEKLALEKQLLQRQLSVQGLLMAWVQAAAVPVALLGAILAFFVGFGQLRQSEDNQVADRFDKALTRLASRRPEERMTGVSGLELFLSNSNASLQKQALQFLVNGLSVEQDTRVRGAILNVLTELPGRPSQAALNAALRTAVERNRSLTKSIVDNWPRRIAQRKRETLAKFEITGLDLDRIGDEIPAHVLAALTTEQYLALLDSEHGRFTSLDAREYVPLIGLRTAIETLVARGATTLDFKDIYCEECNFTRAKSLDRAIFDGAYIANANFAHISLRGASFRDADLGGTSFFGADLTNADLRTGRLQRGFAIRGDWEHLPLLECTKLRGANLSGQPLLLFIKEFDTTTAAQPTYEIVLPRMSSVQLDASTKLDAFRILTAIKISDDYLKQNTTAPEVQHLIKVRSGVLENPLAKGYWQTPNFWRFHGTQGEDVAKSTFTVAMMDWDFGPSNIKDLGEEAFMLRGFVDQSALKALPLYSRFVNTVGALSVAGDGGAKAARTWSDTAGFAKVKPLPCSERVAPTAALLFHLSTDESE